MVVTGGCCKVAALVDADVVVEEIGVTEDFSLGFKMSVLDVCVGFGPFGRGGFFFF